MPLVPDLPGFRDAQERLRGAFGEDVTFRWPDEPVWPEGTRLDRETGRPHDPLVEPVTNEARVEVVRGNVASSTGVKGQSDATAFGELEVGDLLVILDLDLAPTVAGSVTFEVRDEVYEIRSRRDDGIAGKDRHLIFGERSG